MEMVLSIFKLLQILRNSSVWLKDSVEQEGEAMRGTANTGLLMWESIAGAVHWPGR